MPSNGKPKGALVHDQRHQLWQKKFSYNWSQISMQTTSWSASNVRNGYVGNVSSDGEVRQIKHDKVPGEGCSGKPEFGSKPVCDAWTQLPGMSGNPSEALSSVALAYQVFFSYPVDTFFHLWNWYCTLIVLQLQL